ncbi:MAG: dihydrolipoamide acetyltransferase family protein [Bacteroidota bacterium]
MALVDLVMPKMGESIMEATILKWEKSVGDTIEVDEDVLLIATDKVDTEVPSPVAGVLQEVLFEEGDTVEVGKIIARIVVEGEEPQVQASPAIEEIPATNGKHEASMPEKEPAELVKPATSVAFNTGEATRFYSPLVKSIAKKEGIPVSELETISGTGAKGRVTKKDILAYLKVRTGEMPAVSTQSVAKTEPKSTPVNHPQPKTTPVQSKSVSGGDTIIEMDRMRKLIAEHMVRSKQVSPHVTSFVEADVTNLFNWRNKNKAAFMERFGQKLTFTPIFIEIIARTIKDFPMINVSVEGENIIVHNDINVGMAAALPSGNLIVPVIKNADLLNLGGLATTVNDLVDRARNNKLKPDDIQGGTFTLTNVGTFGNLAGTPIINQPQVAIMATGAIQKKPAVVETEFGDMIAVRRLMMLSMSYDHRVVDGFLGGSFLRRVADYLEAFDPNREL